MRLWRRAAGAVKDHGSIWRCTVSSSSSSSSSYIKRKGDHLETMIVKATSHDETRMDYKNTQRLFAWIIASPDDVIKPLVCFLSMRLQKTRNWVVALKALMLFHGLLRCSNIPHIQNLGRLPFDLSTFTDAAHSSSCYNAVVRAYFDFLDHKSTTLSSASPEPPAGQPIITHLLSFHSLLLSSLELLFQVRPQTSALRGGGRVIILEAMDCIVMEVIDVYSKICGCVKRMVSPTILLAASSNKEDLLMVLEALQQSKHQEEELHQFLQFYKDLGLVLNASDLPNFDYVTQDEINQLHHLLANSSNYNPPPGQEEEEDHSSSSNRSSTQTEHNTLVTSTIITENWEVFEDDLINARDSLSTSQLSCQVPSSSTTNTNVNVYKQLTIPDFITF